MFMKLAKLGVLSVVTIGLAGALVFGRDAFSYVNSSMRSARSAVKDAVPVEFQLRRARDLVDDIIPEMHANIRLIAQQEVEISRLSKDISRLTSLVANLQPASSVEGKRLLATP